MLVIVLALSFIGLAAAQGSVNVTTETLALRCVTQSGPSSRALLETKTKTPALTTRITSNLTSTPTIIITPSPVIDTVIVNLTLTNTGTQQQSTNIITNTETQSVTAVFTVVATNMSTSFVTEFKSSTTSATITASPGFVPIQSVIQLAGGVLGKRDEIYARAKKPAAQFVVQDDGTIITTPRQYPVRVQCLKVIYVTITRFRTIVAAAETITAEAPRMEITVTSTFVANATELQADITQLITETVVATISTTLTVELSTSTVSTVTETIYSTYPTPYYAACGPDNIARSIDGVPIGRMGVKNTFGTLTANTPYDCCVRGVQGEYAGTFFKQGICFLIAQSLPAVCDPQEQAFTFSTVATLDMSDAIVISNGNCGQGQYVDPPAGPQVAQ